MPVPRKMPIPPTCPFQKTLKIIPLLSNALKKAMQRGLGEPVPPKGVPPMSDCRGLPHSLLHQESDRIS
ncbi:MAG: hypothetical protein F6J94_21560 [Moorea sp. SIO1F2]|uniref:hypothetical protein n=1 Tax=unclassified Moorena TaxID=2683338 RepID=UPI0013B8AA98|nr:MULTISPECIES: hypothetical protein [unclassified Moorena]NET84407.1 hypothetical protein [Moorena sp. SIO1F2]